MFSIQEAVFGAGTLLPLALSVFGLAVGIVVSKLSEWNGKGGWHRSR